MSLLVKFTSPQEFYDWYDANRAELLAFKEAHDSSIGLGSHFYSVDNLRLAAFKPNWRFSQLKPLNLLYWNQFGDDYPANQKEDVFQEDEIYIVANSGPTSFENRKNKWWVIYIPIPLYKVNNSTSNPFQKEAWWYYKEDEPEPNFSAAPDLEWITGFIKYGGEPPRRRLTFNYPIGGI